MPDPLIALLIAAILAGLGLLLFLPKRGLIPRWQRGRQMTERVLIEGAGHNDLQQFPAYLEAMAQRLR